ncbi:Co2+/Mg2+ efflux protein ApaG [Acetobacter vaccinii]|uniref:Protein ApaG n=1 Tax=Acetobacter vaccinii TaxID=2592655 RepID=A0A5C1YNP8_9PROT|nr:Co2+/Mg2+ efflux protein ApaG [Acetobacter vaccinii]QEO17924.1 Co2+/Mg2+ efflux protein ApaG [Acetobacter vaccinii]
MADWAVPSLVQDPQTALDELFSALPVYEARTGDIRVQVQVFWLPDQSEPDESSYSWAYRVRIRNMGAKAVRLLERTWHIIDSTGHNECVQGAGVIGQQPVIQPGAEFDYTSGTSLTTPGGFMRGAYLMQVVSDGTRFDAEIPAFSLDCPFQIHQLH